jgi:hypothetical protein
MQYKIFELMGFFLHVMVGGEREIPAFAGMTVYMLWDSCFRRNDEVVFGYLWAVASISIKAFFGIFAI